MEKQILFRREADMAQWWLNHAPLNIPLQTTDGAQLTIMFQGRPGTGKGPDFCDAAIHLNGAALSGDIELHLRAGGWFTHGHAEDLRYSRVILHVIAAPMADAGRAAITASGARVPSLLADAHLLWRSFAAAQPVWPCQSSNITTAALIRLGERRFQEKKQRFMRMLRQSESPARNLEAILFGAIAEACLYGRNYLPARTEFAELFPAGEHFAAVGGDAIGVRRLKMLAETYSRRAAGQQLAIWLCGAAFTQDPAQFWQTLRRWLADEPKGGIGVARADIIIWNAILPVLAAYASVCGAVRLESAALQCALQAPGLQSNILTRYMKSLWGLRQLPRGAAAQQGMHAVYSGWCKEKRCADCPMAYLG